MRTERTFLGRALTYIGKRVGYATRGHSLHFQAVTSRRRFGLRLTALGSGLVLVLLLPLRGWAVGWERTPCRGTFEVDVDVGGGGRERERSGEKTKG